MRKEITLDAILDPFSFLMNSQCRGKGGRPARGAATLRRSFWPRRLRRLRRCDAATLPATPDAATPPTLRRCDAPGDPRRSRRLRRCDAATLPATSGAATPPTLRRCDASGEPSTLRRLRRCDAAMLGRSPGFQLCGGRATLRC
eukprot:s1796_g16.t1